MTKADKVSLLIEKLELTTQGRHIWKSSNELLNKGKKI